jgi:hypothetical protein
VCSLRFTELSGPEQHERVAEAASRVQWPATNAPAVCVLDCGVNRGHPLLAPLIDEGDMFTLHPPSGTADHPQQPHGTQMACLAAFGHLVALLDSAETWPQRHRLESVKILKNAGENEPELYGDLIGGSAGRQAPLGWKTAKAGSSSVWCEGQQNRDQKFRKCHRLAPDRRLAARPVSAHNRQRTFLARRMSRITGHQRRPSPDNPVDAVLNKPFDLSQLRKAVAGLVSEAGESLAA